MLGKKVVWCIRQFWYVLCVSLLFHGSLTPTASLHE